MSHDDPRPTRRAGRAEFPNNEDPPLGDLLARLAERDAREARDDRTPAERWLGDPQWFRSALDQHGARILPISGTELGQPAAPIHRITP